MFPYEGELKLLQATTHPAYRCILVHKMADKQYCFMSQFYWLVVINFQQDIIHKMFHLFLITSQPR